jgi:hypothetical protein
MTDELRPVDADNHYYETLDAEGFTPVEVQRIMRGNCADLVGLPADRG